jgi:hypothetical protein
MSRVRRLYFYLVCYASLSMLLSGLAISIRVILEQALGVGSSGVLFGFFSGREQFREQTALGIALVAIGLPVWLLHWRALQGWLRGASGRDERRAALRRLYVYAVLATTALTAYSAARDLMAHLIGLPLGLSTDAQQAAGIARPLPYLLVAAIFWAYHWRIAADDRVGVGEGGASATLRRWYVYGMAAFGVTLLIANLTVLGQQLWLTLFDRGALAALGPILTPRTVAEGGGTALVSLVVWLLHRGWSERAASSLIWHSENERHSVLRRVYLYAVVAGTVALALTNASQVARFVLLNLLGESVERVGGEPALLALGRPLANILVFGLFWVFYWRSVRQEASAEPEVGRQAGVRRLYFYVVAAVSLAILASSLAGLLRVMVDSALQVPSIGPGSTRRDIANYLSMLIVALPVWLYHWSTAQALMAGPGGPDEARSTTRRWYLYLVAFAGLIVLLVSGAWIVYDLVLVVLGRPLDRQLQAEIGRLLANSLVAMGVLWYHRRLVVRAELPVRKQLTAERTAVAVIAGLDQNAATALERFARESLGRARMELVWTDQAQFDEAVGSLLRNAKRLTREAS